MTLNLKKAIETINSGGTLLYPTDTIWGLGGDASNENVIQRIFEIKKRPDSKSLVSLVSDMDMLKSITEVSAEIEELIASSTKPTTVIFEDVTEIHPSAKAENGSAAIRIVLDEFCQELIKIIGKPLLSTSANISGEDSPKCFADVSEEIKAGADYIATHRREEISHISGSRILKLEGNQVKVIRH